MAVRIGAFAVVVQQAVAAFEGEFDSDLVDKRRLTGGPTIYWRCVRR